MAKQNAQLVALNRGEVSKLGLTRIDVEKLKLAAACQLNWLPYVLGAMSLRPGLNVIGEVLSDQPGRLVRFVYSKLDTSLIELTPLQMRIWINDQLLTRPAVTTAISDGLFNGGGTWNANNSTAGTQVTVGGGAGVLTCKPLSGLAQLQQTVTVGVGNVGVEHGLRINIGTGPVTVRVGSTGGKDEFVSTSLIDSGTHSLSFVPTTSSFVIQFESTKAYSVSVSQCTIEPAGVVQVPTPWAAGDLPNVRYDQSGDIVYVACAGQQQRKIERRGVRPGARGWSVVVYNSEDGPFGADNGGPVQLATSVFEGNGTLTSTLPFFEPGHVGCLFRLFTLGQNNGTVLGGANAFSTPARVSGVGTASRNYAWALSGTCSGTVNFERSFDGADGGFTVVSQQVVSGVVSGSISSATGGTGSTPDLDNIIAWERVGFETGEYVSGALTVQSNYAGGGAFGICRVTGYTNPSSVNITVLSPFSTVGTTNDWAQAEWSGVQGWPTSVAFHEGRLGWYGRDHLWLSGSDAYTSFAAEDSTGTTLGDAGVIDEAMGSGPFDNIPWALSLTRLLVGREQSIASVRSSNFDQPLTPTAIVVRDCSDQGAARLPAIKVGKRGIFVQQSGRKVYELAFNPQEMDYGDRDLTRLNLDIGLTGFVDIDKAIQPDRMIWLPRGDGQCAGLLYDVDDDVIAWWRMQTLGIFENVAVLPSNTVEDFSYYIVNRTVNGVTKRFIEKLAPRGACVGGAINQQLDCAQIYQGAAVQTLQHTFLLNTPIAVWADGAFIGNALTDGAGNFTMPDGLAHGNVVYGLGGTTVSATTSTPTATLTVGVQYSGFPCEVFADIGGSGRIKRVGPLTVSAGVVTLPNGAVATTIMAFLGYVAPFESAKLAYAAQMGSPLNQRTKIDGLGLVLYDTAAQGLMYGQTPDQLDSLPLEEADSATPAGTVWPEYEEPMFTLNGTWDTDARLFLLAQAPNPCTVGAVVIGMQKNG